jgi:membrane associated rhomboid family serine protease
MELDAKDIEAIGRSRSNRAIPQNMKYLMYVSLIICLVGIYVAYGVNAMYGIGIMVVGVILLWVYSSAADKKRKIMVKRLKREYQDELKAGKV